MPKDITGAFFMGASLCQWKIFCMVAICKNVRLTHANICKVAWILLFPAVVCVALCFVNECIVSSWVDGTGRSMAQGDGGSP